MTKIKPFMCAMCGGGHSDAQSALACCAAKNDVVERPPHYNQGGIECIEAIEASMRVHRLPNGFGPEILMAVSA